MRHGLLEAQTPHKTCRRWMVAAKGRLRQRHQVRKKRREEALGQEQQTEQTEQTEEEEW